jgi:hypothetical protein
MTWADGATYVGAWKEGLKSGRGVYTWPNGDTWEGEWEDDLSLRVGLFRYAAGTERRVVVSNASAVQEARDYISGDPRRSPKDYRVDYEFSTDGGACAPDYCRAQFEQYPAGGLGGVGVSANSGDWVGGGGHTGAPGVVEHRNTREELGLTGLHTSLGHMGRGHRY